MRRSALKAQGFTLVELLIVLVIVGILVGALLLVASAGTDKAQAARVVSDLRNLKAAAAEFNASSGSWPSALSDLSGYLDGPLECVGPVCYEVASSEAGAFVGFRADLARTGVGVRDRLKGMAGTVSLYSDTALTKAYGGELLAVYPVGYAGSGGLSSAVVPLSPLGSTFAEISAEMIRRLMDYNARTGGWPSTWKDSRYSDLGLDPALWGEMVPYAHITYAPTGSKVAVRPEEGYGLTMVMKSTGQEVVLWASLKWNLWYDATTGKWYFHNISPENEVDVSTLKAIPKP